MYDDDLSAMEKLYEYVELEKRRSETEVKARQQARAMGKLHTRVNTATIPPEPPKRIIETTRITKDELEYLSPEMRLEMLRNRLLVENIKEGDLYPQLDNVCKGLYLVSKGPNPITMMINFETKADLTKFKLAVKI